MFKRLIFIVVVILLNSCNDCNTVSDISIEYILPVAKSKGYPYCSTFKDALNKEPEAIRKFSLFEFSDAMGYEHGGNIIILIDVIGEDSFMSAMNPLKKKEKERIKMYIDAELQFGYHGDKKRDTIEKVFPKLAMYFR